MPFFRVKNDAKFELRNVWVLDTGERTQTPFTYEQFVRNCMELQHFGYVYEKMTAYQPKYMKAARRAYPGLIGIKLTEEEKNLLCPAAFFDLAECSVLRMTFVCQSSGEAVYWYISRLKGIGMLGPKILMWFSKDELEWKCSLFYDNYISIQFGQPVFGTVLGKFGLLGERGGEKSAVSH